MALGFGSKKTESPSEGSNSTDSRQKSYYDGDAEKQQRSASAPRKMSRIDRPIAASITGSIEHGRRPSVEDSPDADITIGKQMELEAGNAIQYRTCSWQKV